MNLVYWQQIAQNKSENKRGQLAQPYMRSCKCIKKVMEAKKYTIVLSHKPTKWVSL